MNIIPVIRDLLLRNQKVVIPGFGSFLVVQRPAQLNKVTRVMTPPARIIRFDRDQQTDDGRLSDYLVSKLKQEPGLTEKALKEFVVRMDSQLTNSGFAELEGIGTIKKQRSGEMTFTPDDELLKRISFFELPNIRVPGQPTEKLTPPTVVTKDISVVRKRRSTWWIPVTLLLITAGLLAIVQITGNLDELISDMKALAGIEKETVTEKIVFGNSVDDVDTADNDTLRAQISRKLDEQLDREKALAYEEAEAASERESETVKPAPSPISTIGVSKPFHIIAGAFRNPENAEKQKAVLMKQGYSSVILPRHNNFYMVSLGSYDTHDQAYSALENLNTKPGIELWVLKR